MSYEKMTRCPPLSLRERVLVKNSIGKWEHEHRELLKRFLADCDETAGVSIEGFLEEDGAIKELTKKNSSDT